MADPITTSDPKIEFSHPLRLYKYLQFRGADPSTLVDPEIGAILLDSKSNILRGSYLGKNGSIAWKAFVHDVEIDSSEGITEPSIDNSLLLNGIAKISIPKVSSNNGYYADIASIKVNTIYTVTHNLNNTNMLVNVYYSNGTEWVMCNPAIYTLKILANTIKITFNTAVSSIRIIMLPLKPTRISDVTEGGTGQDISTNVDHGTGGGTEHSSDTSTGGDSSEGTVSGNGGTESEKENGEGGETGGNDTSTLIGDNTEGLN
jgi:hypothetical protein